MEPKYIRHITILVLNFGYLQKSGDREGISDLMREIRANADSIEPGGRDLLTCYAMLARGSNLLGRSDDAREYEERFRQVRATLQPMERKPSDDYDYWRSYADGLASRDEHRLRMGLWGIGQMNQDDPKVKEYKAKYEATLAEVEAESGSAALPLEVRKERAFWKTWRGEWAPLWRASCGHVSGRFKKCPTTIHGSGSIDPSSKPGS